MKKQREKKKKNEDNMNPKEYVQYVNHERQKAKERVQKYRQRKKMGNNNTPEKLNEDISKIYSNKATLGKAKKKVERALPMSPTKKKVVLLSIVNGLHENERNELVNVISSKKSTVKRSSQFSELIGEIAEFYERDDVSRVSPKIKDVKKYANKQNGAEELLPTRHMIMTLREAYALFIEDRNSKQKGSIKLMNIFLNYQID